MSKMRAVAVSALAAALAACELPGYVVRPLGEEPAAPNARDAGCELLSERPDRDLYWCGDPEEIVSVVRGGGGSESRAAAYSGSYHCDDVGDCWDNCPEPQQDGGTTVCRCVRWRRGDQFECTIEYFPPGHFPGLGGGGGGGSCTDDQREIATEYQGPFYGGHGDWPCTKFINFPDVRGVGTHGHSRAYLHPRYLLRKHRVLAAAPGAFINSSWRCPVGNSLVGGRLGSQHMEGTAGDFHAPGFHGDSLTAWNTFTEFKRAAIAAGAGHWYEWQDVWRSRYIHVDWRGSGAGTQGPSTWVIRKGGAMRQALLRIAGAAALAAGPLSATGQEQTAASAAEALRGGEPEEREEALRFANRLGWRASDDLKSAVVEAAWWFAENDWAGLDPHEGRFDLLEAVIRTHDPAGLPFLLRHGLGLGNNPQNAVADFGAAAVPGLLELVSSLGGRDDMAGNALWALELIVRDGAAPPELLPQIADAARRRLTMAPQVPPLELGHAAELALALGDPDLRELVEQIAEAEPTAAELDLDPWRAIFVQDHIRGLLDGSVAPPPRMPCPAGGPPGKKGCW